MDVHRKRAPRVAGVVCALALLSGGPMAWADAPKAGTPAAPAAPASAPGSDKSGEEASVRFKRGLQLFDDGDYTLALVEFERAYQLAPNYRALYNIGLVDIQLARYADAVRVLEQYLKDGGDAIPAARRAEVSKKLVELRLRTATVDIAMNAPGAELSLDGKPMDPARLKGPTLIDAGEHTLRATAPGYAPKDRTITLAGGDHVQVRFDLVSLAPKEVVKETAPAPSHKIFWPGFVAAGALAGGAVASGIVMLNAKNHLNDLQNTPGSSANERQSAANRVNAAAVVADVFTACAIAAGGISLYITLTSDSTSKTQVAISPQKVVFVGTF